MIVLFSSGSWSDYGLSGLMEVDAKVFEKAKARYEQLTEDRKVMQKDLEKRALAGNITANQTAEIVKQMDSISSVRFEVWEECKKTGTPVEFVEFWRGDFHD